MVKAWEWTKKPMHTSDGYVRYQAYDERGNVWIADREGGGRTWYAWRLTAAADEGGTTHRTLAAAKAACEVRAPHVAPRKRAASHG